MTDITSAHATVSAVIPGFNLSAIAGTLSKLEGTSAKRVFDTWVRKGNTKYFYAEMYHTEHTPKHLYFETDKQTDLPTVLEEAGLKISITENDNAWCIHAYDEPNPQEFVMQFEFLMNLHKLSHGYTSTLVHYRSS